MSYTKKLKAIYTSKDDEILSIFTEEEVEEITAGSGKNDLDKPFPEHLNRNLEKFRAKDHLQGN